jgi:hypothetical protein
VFGCLLLFLLLFLAAPLWQKLATQKTLLWVELRATQSDFFGNLRELQMCRSRWEMYVQSAKRGKQRRSRASERVQSEKILRKIVRKLGKKQKIVPQGVGTFVNWLLPVSVTGCKLQLKVVSEVWWVFPKKIQFVSNLCLSVFSQICLLPQYSKPPLKKTTDNNVIEFSMTKITQNWIDYIQFPYNLSCLIFIAFSFMKVFQIQNYLP